MFLCNNCILIKYFWSFVNILFSLLLHRNSLDSLFFIYKIRFTWNTSRFELVILELTDFHFLPMFSLRTSKVSKYKYRLFSGKIFYFFTIRTFCHDNLQPWQENGCIHWIISKIIQKGCNTFSFISQSVSLSQVYLQIEF